MDYNDNKSRNLIMQMFTDLRNGEMFEVDSLGETFNVELEWRKTWKKPGPCSDRIISVPLRKAKFFLMGKTYYVFFSDDFSWFGMIDKDCMRDFACKWEDIKDRGFIQEDEVHSEIDFKPTVRLAANLCTVFKPWVKTKYPNGERFYAVPSEYCKYYEVSEMIKTPQKFGDWVQIQKPITHPSFFE